MAAKIVISTAMLSWILSRSNLTEVFAALAGASLPLLLIAYTLNFVGALISAARWHGLLLTHGVVVPVPTLLKSVLVGLFFNNFLPSTVGGDAMRAYDSYRISQSGSAMTSVVVDRLLGLLVLTLFALVSLPFATELSETVPLLPLWVTGGGAVLLGIAWLVFFPPSLEVIGGLISILPGRLQGLAGKIVTAFAAYRGRRAALAKAFGWSLLLQANVVVHYWIVALALGFSVPLLHFFLIVPLAIYIMMLPVTVNGIGVRENVLALFLAAYGIGSGSAVAYAWLIYLGSVMYGLLGGVVYALRRVEPVTAQVGHLGAD